MQIVVEQSDPGSLFADNADLDPLVGYERIPTSQSFNTVLGEEGPLLQGMELGDYFNDLNIKRRSMMAKEVQVLLCA